MIRRWKVCDGSKKQKEIVYRLGVIFPFRNTVNGNSRIALELIVAYYKV
jgi:hypothetical protein